MDRVSANFTACLTPATVQSLISATVSFRMHPLQLHQRRLILPQSTCSRTPSVRSTIALTVPSTIRPVCRVTDTRSPTLNLCSSLGFLRAGTLNADAFSRRCSRATSAGLLHPPTTIRDTRTPWVIQVSNVVFARIFPNVTEIVVRPICRPNFNNLEPITGVLKSAAVLQVLHLKIVLAPKVGLEFL